MPGSLAPIVALLALPMLAALLPQLNNIPLIRRRVIFGGRPMRALQYGAWGATAAVILLLLPQRFEFALGAWMPVSVTGAPLMFANRSDALLLLLAAIGVQFLRALDRGRLRATDAFMVVSLALFGMVNNLPALLVCLGLVDLAAALDIGRDAHPAQRVHQSFLNGASLVLLIIACAVHVGAQNSAWFPLAQFGPQAANLVLLAALVRFAALFAAPAVGNAQWSHAATFLLMARMFELGVPAPRTEWVIGALLIASVKFIAAWLSAPEGATSTIKHLATGTCALAACSLAYADSERAVLAAIGWVLGVALISIGHDQSEGMNSNRGARLGALFARGMGLLALIGFPFMAAYAGGAGILAWMTGHSSFGAAIGMVWGLAYALLMACCLRLLFATRALQPDFEPNTAPEATPSTPVAFLRIGIALLMAVLLFATGLAGTNAGFVRARGLGLMTLLDWLVWIIAVLFGVALWWLEARLLAWLDRPMFASDTKTLRSRLHSAFDANGLGNLFGDSFAALGRPLGGVFAFLESDGALIWGVIVVLIALLVNRPGGP